MEVIPQTQIQKGTLMIASPENESTVFHRAVMLICEHNNTGSFGLIINKLLEIELPEELLNIDNLANKHVSMRASGPVQTNQMMLLHGNDNPEIHTLKICDGVYLGGDLQFLQEMLTKEDGPFMHLCFGYSGWAGGQLEREFLDGNWFVFPASAHYIFEIPPDQLWRTLLHDMGGKYATLSMIPEDLSVN